MAGEDAIAGNAHVLLGKKAGNAESLVATLKGLQSMPYLKDDRNNIRVVIQRIPNTKWSVLNQPVPVRDAMVRFADTVDIVLPDFGPSEAYVVTLTTPASARQQ